MAAARLRVRPWLRALHRDVGYLAVGLTVIYALSGLAVNHIADWDPNFTQVERQHRLQMPLAPAAELPSEPQAQDRELAQRVLSQLGIAEAPSDVYRSEPQRLQISLSSTTLHVDTEAGTVFEEGQRERLFLRVANWLHLNRGKKKAWTWIADGYAVFLLFLAISGLFMLPGRKGLLGRGGVLVVLGAAVPVLYVALSGGP
jgi:hypothetical protein